jgi:hypothetical protein
MFNYGTQQKTKRLTINIIEHFDKEKIMLESIKEEGTAHSNKLTEK